MTTAPRSSRLSAEKVNFQGKLSLGLTVATCALFGVLAVVYGGQNGNDYRSTTRRLDDGANDADGGNDDAADYTSYSCHYIFDQTPDPGAAQCQFARECNQGAGLWAPRVFCSSWMSTTLLTALLSPVILLWMVLLFRMLASTAEDFFSPSLEMFSAKLGLPPRFAGVTLLALGNGAADVSATISAIANDPENGYKLSLGALTGAAMVIGSVVSALVVLVAGGVPCRGALLRDVLALLVAVLVVWYKLGVDGQVTSETVTLFLSLYFTLVVLVLVADTYHRAVVVPRLALQAQASERQRQLDEEQRLSEHLEDEARSNPVDRVITAISNYDNANANLQPFWGIESEDLMDRPVMLHGTHGILSNNSQTVEELAVDTYTPLGEDTLCAEPSTGLAAATWSTAFSEGWMELLEHFATVWDDIAWNGDLDLLTKFLLICEWPFTTLRQLTVPIPCEGYYRRSLVALSLVLSPFWFAYYMWDGHEVNVWSHWTVYGSVCLAMAAIALAVLRFAPGGEGTMALWAATPIALYGFIIGATWIDTIADALVSLLDFIGIILRIPGPIVGLTILAWGNSMGDLSANITMARKGLANMAVRDMCVRVCCRLSSH